MLSLGVFGVLYFRIVAVNGPCHLELADLEISFRNVYSVGRLYIGIILFICILNLLYICFFSLTEFLIHLKKKTAFLHGCSCSLCYF